MNDIQSAAAILGAIGGKAGVGKCKSRSSSVMRLAGLKGWQQRRLKMPEKFWLHVSKGNPDECWNWASSLNYKGYGMFSINKHFEGAHRVAWKLTNGEIPDGLFVCHHCDNPKCCNPAHLFLGTVKDNYDDMVKKGRNVVLRGINNGRAKLDPEKIERMKQLRKEGATYVAIGKMYGVTTPAARYAVIGHTWSHV